MRLHLIPRLFVSCLFAAGASGQSPDVIGSQGNVLVNGGDSVLTDAGVVLRAKTLPSVGAQFGGSAGKFVIFNASNVELLRVESGGDVGIGTTDPKGILHLARANPAGGLGPELIIENTSSLQANGSAITFSSANAPRIQIYSGIDHTAQGNLQLRRLWPDTSTLAYLTGNGELLIYGGPIPFTLRRETNGVTALVQVTDLVYEEGLLGGFRMQMHGNSDIRVSGLQIGRRTEPVIRALVAREVLVEPRLNVRNLSGNADLAVTSGNDPGLPYSPAMTLKRLDGNDALLAAYSFHLDPRDNKLKLLYSTTSDFSNRADPAALPAPLMTIAPASATGPAELSFNGVIVGAVYQDLAEWVPATVDVDPGTVVVLNPEKNNEVMPSEREYDLRVAGVISAQPGLLLGPGGAGKEMVATTGRVRVKVYASEPIAVGDLLVSSNKPGMAMKSRPVQLGGVAIHRPGTIIGKALEPLESGEGEILVLLSLQ